MSEPTQENMQKTFRLRRRIAGAAVVLLATAGVVAMAVFLPALEKKKQETQEKLINVQVMPIRPVPALIDAFILPAIVEPNVTVTVSAEVAGRVEKINCKEGRPCKPGDGAMIELNTDLLAAEVARARAQRDLDQYDLDSISKLRKSRIETEFTWNKAKAALAASKAVLKAADANLKRAKIAAPISGILETVAVEKGEYVQAGTHVATIVDVDRVRVVAEVPERDVHYLAVGSEQDILPDPGGRNGPIKGRIDYISQLADRASRTSRVEILVDNRKRVLRSGQIVRLRLRRRVVKDAIMIPLGAVIAMEDSRVVYVVNANRAERRTVERGFFRGRNIQILSGLSAGDRLIVKGQRYVAPGQVVNVIETAPPPGSPSPARPVEKAANPPAEAGKAVKRTKAVDSAGAES